MTVCYMDLDDEITDAVARLRSADDRRFILVLPQGSRVATSRINFRLLAKEGLDRSVAVALVSGDAGVRSLAISAGMPAYGTVDEAEASLPVGSGQATAATAAMAQVPVGPPVTTGMTPATPVEPMAAQAWRNAHAPQGGTPAASPPWQPGAGRRARRRDLCCGRRHRWSPCAHGHAGPLRRSGRLRANAPGP